MARLWALLTPLLFNIATSVYAAENDALTLPPIEDIPAEPAAAELMPALATTNLPLMTLREPGDFSIGTHAVWYEDVTANLTPDQALDLDPSLWQPSEDEAFNFGFSDSAYWLKMRVMNDSAREWSLWIRYSLLDYVDIYLCPEGITKIEQCEQKHGGDEYPFAEGRDLDHPNLIYHTPMTPGREYLMLMRIQTTGTQQIPAAFVDALTLQHELLSNNIIRGGYYATMLVMGLYNLFIFFSTRERSYFYYSAVTLTFLMFHMSYEGSGFQFFWPERPQLNHFALPLMFSINMICISLFVPNFLRLKKYSRSTYRLFRVYTAMSVLSLAMLPLVPYQIIVPLNNLLSSLLLISALLVGIRFWLQGQSSARFFTIAWVALIAGLIMANARSLGWIPTNTVTLYAYQIGSFMEIILLSLALGERIVRLQKEQLEARQAMMRSQEDAIQYLRDYEDLYQNSLTGKFQLDDEGYFIKSNPAWRRILGYTDQARFTNENPPFNSLLADNTEQHVLWRKLRDQGHVQGHLVQIIPPGSSERLWVSLTIRRRTTSEKAAWIGSGQNVTDEYNNEQALIQLQKEKTQALRQLVMGIAHEMNTPLGNIRMAESFLAQEHEDWTPDEINAHLKDGLSHIHEGINRLNTLNQLMKNAVVEENQYLQEKLQLRPWLENWAQEMQALHPGVTLSAQVHSYLIDWETYPEALNIILSQLVDNSCRHNPEQLEKGDLTIRVDFRERNNQFELHYQDNGKGIEEDQRDVIFMPFYTTQRTEAENKGLGLYQTYNLITELLQGQIEWPAQANGFSLLIRFILPKDFAKKDETPDIPLDGLATD